MFGENLVYTYKPRMNRIEGVRLLSRIRRWSRVPALLPLCFATVAVSAQTLTTLYSFDGADGAQPTAGLVEATDGDLYGTTLEGGAYRSGSVFRITPSGVLTTLYSFCSQSACEDGAEPYGGLVQAGSGSLYGTTEYGGGNNECTSDIGCGTVFRISLSGKLTTLYRFCSQAACADGNSPLPAPAPHGGGIPGTTRALGCGTVFKIDPAGALTTLYRFCSQNANPCMDGQTPLAGLVWTTSETLYGTTEYGGTGVNCCVQGCGTIFRITPSGKLATIYNFSCSASNCPDGIWPIGGLVQGADGDLYGTTPNEGAGLQGTVFKLGPTGTLTTLHNFCVVSACADGANPVAALVQSADGTFYGTTRSGGAREAFGTLFSITPAGAFATLSSFDGANGANPSGALFQGANGDLYGTTKYGGASGVGASSGTIFIASISN